MLFVCFMFVPSLALPDSLCCSRVIVPCGTPDTPAFSLGGTAVSEGWVGLVTRAIPVGLDEPDPTLIRPAKRV